VVNRDTNQWIAGANLKTHTRNLVLNFLKKPSLPLPPHQLSVLIVISQELLNNNVTRSATSQPRRVKRLMICYWLLIKLTYPKGLTSHFTPNTFIADSGATCNMRGSIEGMFNLKPHVTVIMVGINETMSSISMGNHKGLDMQKDSTSFVVILQDVLYIPKLMVNLFSLTKAISTKGVQLSNKGQIITLKIGKIEIFFGTIFQHGSGQLLGIELYPIPSHIAATANPLDINKLHTMFGHPNSQVLAATVSKYSFKSKNTLEHTCPNCAICKAKK
jgi:hypothetical protein